MDADDRADFIRSNTTLMAPPLVPEVRLHLAHEAVPLWQKTEEQLGEMGLPPPFWAFAWAGGQALARYVIDHPNIVRGRRVTDLASGSGLVGIAALKAGAAHVLAADIDLFAGEAMRLNAAANGISSRFPSPPHLWGRGQGEGVTPAGELVDVSHAAPPPHPNPLPPMGERGQAFTITTDDLLAAPPPAADVILVGDLFYEKALAALCFDWLTRAATQGSAVLIGDPGRSYLPREKLAVVAEYSVPVTRDLEDAEIKRSCVWRLANC